MDCGRHGPRPAAILPNSWTEVGKGQTRSGTLQYCRVPTLSQSSGAPETDTVCTHNRKFETAGPMRRALLAQAAGVITLCLTTPQRRWPAHAAALPTTEPEAARKLFDLCQGRRPGDWTADEKLVVDSLVNELVALRTPWRNEYARGKWRLAYLQRGFDSKPPPAFELPVQEQFQIFSQQQVVNVAEIGKVWPLFGAAIEIRAAGLWLQDDPGDPAPPKQFRADIDQGALCGAITMGSVEKANIGRACVPLPLRGETYRIFEGEYLSPRLRIGQDINSGGARVVQLRVDSFSGRR